jgi:hypothetical protein
MVPIEDRNVAHVFGFRGPGEAPLDRDEAPVEVNVLPQETRALAFTHARVQSGRVEDEDVLPFIAGMSLRTIVFIDASARRYVESTPATLPRSSPLDSTIPSTKRNTSS